MRHANTEKNNYCLLCMEETNKKLNTLWKLFLRDNFNQVFHIQ